MNAAQNTNTTERRPQGADRSGQPRSKPVKRNEPARPLPPPRQPKQESNPNANPNAPWNSQKYDDQVDRW